MSEEEDVEEELEETKAELQGMIAGLKEETESSEDEGNVEEENSSQINQGEAGQDIDEKEDLGSEELEDDDASDLSMENNLDENEPKADNEDRENGLDQYRNDEGKFVDPDTGERFDTKDAYQLYLKHVK